MDADGTNQTRVSPFPGSMTAPAWSPDSERVVYVTDGERVVYVTDADGIDRARLTSSKGPRGTADFYRPVWSPDGEKIGFASRTFTLVDSNLPASAGPSKVRAAVEGLSGIYISNADGTGLCRLTEIDDHTEGFYAEPTWSPDGDKIAFYDDGAIHVINPDGSGLKRLSSTSGSKEAVVPAYPTWSPDGEKLAFSCIYKPPDVQGGVTLTTDLCVINADGTGRKRIASKVSFEEGQVPTSWGRE